MELVYKKTGILFKLLPCLLAVMVAFMTLYGSKVYAVTILDNNTEIELPDFPSDYEDFSYYFLSKDNNNNSYTLYVGDSPFLYCTIEGSNYVLTSIKYYTYHLSNNEWTLDFKHLNSSSRDTIPDNDTYSCLFTSHDILDSEGNVVFQAPTQEVGSQGIIAEQTQGVQMDKTLQEILGILPVVLVVIVGLIAIRKGIVMIKTFLKKS